MPKFSQFTSQASPQDSDEVVGLRSTTNSRFTLSAIWSSLFRPELTATPVTIVEGGTGAATAAAARTALGLGNVDNTSDANKPVSTAQAAAIALKLDADEKGASGGVALADLSNDDAQAALAGRQIYGLPNLYKAYRSAVSGTPTRAKVAYFGDSMAYRMVQYIAPSLLRLMGNNIAGAANVGPINGVTRNSSTGLTTTTDYALWPVEVERLAALGSVTYGQFGVAGFTSNRIVVAYFKNNGGTFKIQINGVDTAYTDVSTAGSGEIAFITLTPTRAANTLTIVNLTGTVSFLVPEFEDTTVSGLSMVNVSLGGMEMASWFDLAGSKARENLASYWAQVLPTSWFFEMKEDAISGLSARIAGVIDDLQWAAPACDIVLLGTTPTSGDNTTNLAINPILASEAVARGKVFFDSQALLPAWELITRLNWGGDGIHLAEDAHRFRASVFMARAGLLTMLGANGVPVSSGADLDSYYPAYLRAALTAAAGTLNLVNSDPSIRFEDTGGLTNAKKIEQRMVSSSGLGSGYVGFRSINDANSVFAIIAQFWVGGGVYFGTNEVNPGAGNVEIGTLGSGLIVKSPDGTRYKLTPANGGLASVWTAV